MDRQPYNLATSTTGGSVRTAVDDAMRQRFRSQFGQSHSSPVAEDSLPTPSPGEIIPAVNAPIVNYDGKPQPLAEPAAPAQISPPGPVSPLPPPAASPPPSEPSPLPPPPPPPPSPPEGPDSAEIHRRLKRAVSIVAVALLLVGGGLWLLLNHQAHDQAAQLKALEDRIKASQQAALKVNQGPLDRLLVKANLEVEGNVSISGQYQINGVQISSADLSDGSGLAHLGASQTFSGANIFSNPSNRFAGDGSGLTGISGTTTVNNITYNVTTTGGSLTTLDGQNGAFYQNSSNQNAGILPDARLSPNVTLQGNSFNGASQLVQLTAGGVLPVLDGSNLTGVTATTLNGQNGAFYQNAGNMNAGILPDARLSPNVTLQGNSFNGASQLVQLTAGGLLPVLNGSNLSNVNAAQLGGQSASYYTNASNISLGTLGDGRLSGNVALYNAATPNFTGTLQHNGSAVCDATNNCNYAPASGGGNYIQNGNSPQTADFNITGDGTIGDTLYFGAGQDTDLYRGAAHTLRTTGALQILNASSDLPLLVQSANSGVDQAWFQVSGDTNPRVAVQGAKISFGPGNATLDTNIYRASAGVLKTDGQLYATGLAIFNQAGGVNETIAGYNCSTGIAGFCLGADTNLYRSAAGVLKTDGTFNAVTALHLNGANINTAGTLSNVAYLNQLNTFTTSQIVQGSVTAERVGDLTALNARQIGDAVSRFTARTTGVVQWSDGTNAADTNLYRSAAATLSTSGSSGATISLLNSADSSNGLAISGGNGSLQGIINVLRSNGPLLVQQAGNTRLTVDANGHVVIANNATVSGGQLALNNGTSNTIFYGSTGVAAPGAGSVGEKIQLFGTSGTVGVGDYALGIEAFNMWFNTSGGYKFYKSSVLQATLDTNGYLGIGVTPTASNGYLQLPGGTTLATGGIGFGTDTSLYRVSAGVLATGGGLNVNGQIAITSNGSGLNFSAGPGIFTAAASNPQFTFIGGSTEYGRFNSSGHLVLNPSSQLGWSATAGTGTADTILYRDSAAVLRTDGTLKVVSSALPSLDLYMNSGTNALQVRRIGDSGIRLAITDTGQLNWGDGTAAADTNLFRAGADALRTNDYFQVVRATPGQGVLAIGDSNSSSDFNWRMVSTGQMFWGPGTSAVDTSLSRSGVNSLQASGNLAALSAIVAGSGASTQVQLTSVAGQAGLYFGSSSDTNLYRNNAAGVLKTDGQFITGGVVGAKVASPDNSFAIDAGGSIRLQGGTYSINFNNGSAEVAGIQVGSGATPNITINGNLTVATNGNITANNALIQAGATIIGATTSINASSNFNTNINTGTSTGAVSIGNTGAASTVLVQGGTSSTAIALQVGSGGTIGIGNGGVASTVQIGNTTGAVNQTINIGNNATLSSSTTVNIGSAIGTSPIQVLTGTSGITFIPTGNSSNVGVKVLPGNDTTAAFLVQNAAGTTTLLNTDTTNLVVTVAGNTTNFATLTLTNSHFKSTQTNAPTIGTPSGCGSSPSAAVNANSTDSAGSFRITAGTGSPGTCSTTISFNKSYGAAPKAVLLQAQTVSGGSGNASQRVIQVTATAAGSFTVNLPAGVLASEVNYWYYWVIE